jgi:hypothetical protein
MDPGTLTAFEDMTRPAVSLILIVLGLITCFAGYRLFKALLAVYGFVLGAALGAVLASSFAGGQLLLTLAGAGLGGLVGAALLVVLYFVGVFGVGAVAGALLANLLAGAIGIDMPVLVLLVAAPVGGLLAMLLQRVAVILATALAGAWAVVGGGAALVGGPSVPLTAICGRPGIWHSADLPYFGGLILWLALAAAGAVVQLLTTADENV